MAPTRRKSYSRELKLEIVKWFHDNGKNVLQTSNKFKVDRKQVREWVKQEEIIIKQNKASFAKRRGTVKYPLLEKKLY